ncbi:tyrosinase cofactor [Streptomyces sp. NBC_00536]|uniref:apotyrosinase chaperone MelC1 n=1 Tax=Streptomyces sp. NBC_00536 TaxID=2975769 RepID=UPI002E8071EF|nr:tyrosinase family oxidase copper chaperone [Streptomyces sp. NBC_00536]WUC76962.1 tyrosinase cofactor [Streptomyces sp. NBC_00536]
MKKITRRQALGMTAGAATAIGLTTACSSSSAGKPAAGPAADASAPGAPGASGVSKTITPIDEVYQGRRIQISLATGGHHDGGHHMPAMPSVRIDGNELHLMPNADGSWITVVNHYETFADPITAARAAVRDLQGAVLVPLGPNGDPA